MDRTLPLFLIGLLFGGAIGFSIAAGNGYTFDDHDHSDASQHAPLMIDHSKMNHGAGDHAMMHEALLEVATEDAPILSILITPDPVAGHNLHVMVENFVFSPQNAGHQHVAGEGHAHVYVNGKKLARLYGNWMHLDALPKGDVTVEVTLNSNNHRPLALQGQTISAREKLTIPE